MFPESPIDTSQFMRPGKYGQEFDYAAAWRAVRPMWETLPANVRDLFAYMRTVAGDIHQDRNLDLPWPSEETETWADTWDPLMGTLRARFGKVPAEVLKRAASVIHSLGHWMPGAASDEDRALFSGSPPDGAHWKFAHYADQSIREREGRPWSGREPTPASELETVCAKLGIIAEAEETGDYQADWDRAGRAYRVTLRYGKRTLSTPFYMGAALEREPTAADVLACLVSDVPIGEQSFEEFCSEFGYDTDSRKAEKTHRQCVKMAPRVRRFLGDAFDRVAGAEH